MYKYECTNINLGIFFWVFIPRSQYLKPSSPSFGAAEKQLLAVNKTTRTKFATPTDAQSTITLGPHLYSTKIT